MAGRPTDYDTKYNEQVYKLCLLGATDEDLASFFNVCKATINNWKIQFPEFLDSIKKGKEIADSNVVESLYKRATGYEHPEDKIFNDGGKAMVVPTIKHYPPDSTAIIFWLKNRQGKNWRDKNETEHSGEIKLPLIQVEILKPNNDGTKENPA